MRFEDVKVGMAVRVNENVREDRYSCTPGMEEMIGKTYTVSDVGKRGFNKGAIRLDNYNWNFSASSLDEVVTNKTVPTIQRHSSCEGCRYRKFYLTTRKRELISLATLKSNMPETLQVVTDGAKKFAVFAKVKGDYKLGVSSCREGDGFNYDIGLALATFRAFGMKREEKEFLTLI